MASAKEFLAASERKDVRDRWLLSLPALIIIFVAALGPLLIVLL